MKQKLNTLLITFGITVVSGIVTVGIIMDSFLVQVALGALYTIITTYLLLCTLQFVIEFIKSKKKTKTNETRIEVQVQYALRDNLQITCTQLFVSDNLKTCVRGAIEHAKNHNYIILEMDLLTTED